MKVTRREINIIEQRRTEKGTKNTTAEDVEIIGTKVCRDGKAKILKKIMKNPYLINIIRMSVCLSVRPVCFSSSTERVFDLRFFVTQWLARRQADGDLAIRPI